MKPVKIFLVALAALAVTERLCAATSSPEPLRPDIDIVRNHDPRLSGYNAAGLYVLPIKKVSVAEAYFGKADGGFVNYHQSDNSYKWGMRTESFFRVSPKVVMYGQVEYSNFTGKSMSGSMFIDPYSTPFDIVEADSVAGKKRLERYRLVGAFSAHVAYGFRVGAKIDYEAANYTKFRDLRHKNTLMNMTVSAGAMWRLGCAAEIGANYIYGRSTEGMEFGIYGNTDQEYNTLISFGSFVGRRLVADQTGYTSLGDDKPVFNEFHGGSFQLNLWLSKTALLFGEFTYKYLTGYYGVRSPGSPVFTDHNADIFESRVGLTLRADRVFHRFSFSSAYEELTNYENIYRRNTGDTGSGTIADNILYFGKTKVLERNTANMHFEYEGQTHWQGFDPVWTFGATGDYYSRSQLTSIYPYHRKQSLKSYAAGLNGGRNFRSGLNGYKITAGVSYGSGSGTPIEDGTYVTPSTSSTAPTTLDDILQREFEYLTADRLGASLGFRYMRDMKNGIRGYAAIEGTFTKAFDLDHISQSTHGSVTIKIGCSF